MADRPIRLNRIALVALAVFFAPAAAAAPAAAPAPAYALLGQHVPTFSADLAGGGALTDAALTGKWSVIEFWGLWCEDSLADLKYTGALARAIAQDPSLQFVTIHVDDHYGTYGSPEEFQKEEGVTYPIALDPRSYIKGAFQVKATPTYLVVDPSGMIRAAHNDLRKSDDPDGGVKALIKEIAAMKAADKRRGG